MRLIHRASLIALGVVSFLGTGGCQSGPVGCLPAGPGVATDSDLTPWLVSAKETRQFGCLMEFNVASPQSTYITWGLATVAPEDSVEVDVRGCLGAAQDFREKSVIVTGKLIPRNQHHLPLLVAERIVPADNLGKELPDFAHHVAMAPDLDPATDRLDPMLDFHDSARDVPVLAGAE